MLQNFQMHTESIFICLGIIVTVGLFIQKKYVKSIMSLFVSFVGYVLIFMPDLILTGEFNRADSSLPTLLPFIVCGALGTVVLVRMGYEKIYGEIEPLITPELDDLIVDVEEQPAAPMSLREELQDRYTAIKEAIVAYSMDIGLAIRYPVMNDPTDEFTASMLKALKRANSKSEDDVEVYQDAVDDLELKFEQAEYNAKKIALSRVSEADQQDFRLAQNLLNQIKDHATSKESRAIFSDKLRSVIERINERNNVNMVPQEAVRKIEQYSRKELTA